MHIEKDNVVRVQSKMSNIWPASMMGQPCVSRYELCDPSSSYTMCGLFLEQREIERHMAQWLERGALLLSLPAARFRIPGAGFSEKYHVSPLSILGHCFNVASLGKALNLQMPHLTQVKMSTW